jgi:CRP/FNR family transcriptional regulator, cyclic AMP receptor protein
VGAGDLLGITPAVGQSLSTGTTRTLAPTQAIELNASQVLTLCEHNPRFGYEFMRQVALAISQRLNATRLQLLDVFGGEQGTGSEADNKLRGTA